MKGIRISIDLLIQLLNTPTHTSNMRICLYNFVLKLKLKVASLKNGFSIFDMIHLP